jgi:hypothetical protein
MRVKKIKKAIILICESMTRYDIGDNNFDGHKRYNLNTSGLEPQNSYRTLRELFFLKNKKINMDKYIKSKVIAIIFPEKKLKNHFPELETYYTNEQEKLDIEPNCKMFTHFKKYMTEEFYKNDTDLLIYWASVGHIGRRLTDEEERGGFLTESSKYWFDIIKTEVFPMINFDDTLVLINNDHGTKRVELKWKQTFDGFLFLKDPLGREKDMIADITYKDIQATLIHYFNIDEKIKKEVIGCSLLK